MRRKCAAGLDRRQDQWKLSKAVILSEPQFSESGSPHSCTETITQCEIQVSQLDCAFLGSVMLSCVLGIHDS